MPDFFSPAIQRTLVLQLPRPQTKVHIKFRGAMDVRMLEESPLSDLPLMRLEIPQSGRDYNHTIYDILMARQSGLLLGPPVTHSSGISLHEDA